MTILKIIQLLTLTVSMFSCQDVPVKHNETVQVEKITRKKLDAFFGHQIQPYLFNDLIIPVNEINATYTKYAVAFFNWRGTWQLTDSISYSGLANNGIIVNDKDLITSKTDNYGKYVFEYDKSNRLVKKQHFDKLDNREGYTEFLYNSNYSEMYEVATNKNTPEKHDTLKHYQFDGNGKPTTITEYGKTFTIVKSIVYNDKGLIQQMANKIHSNELRQDNIVQAKYNYEFNKQGDWIVLTVEVLIDNNYKPYLLCKRVIN